MVRALAFVAIVLGVGLAYEEYTGDDIGIKRTVRAVGAFFGGFGNGAGAASPAFGGWGTLGGGN